MSDKITRYTEHKEETESGADPVGSQHTINGWGLPAGEDDCCPKCGSENYYADLMFGKTYAPTVITKISTPIENYERTFVYNKVFFERIRSRSH